MSRVIITSKFRFLFLIPEMRVTSFILISGILLQLFSKPLILLEFSINRIYINQVLCEQRSFSENSCKGKCHLRKQLKKDDQQDSKNNMPKSTQSEIVWFNNYIGLNGFILYPLLRMQTFNELSLQTSSGIIPGVFHPPSA
jgi:hypothetical protein